MCVRYAVYIYGGGCEYRERNNAAASHANLYIFMFNVNIRCFLLSAHFQQPSSIQCFVLLFYFSLFLYGHPVNRSFPYPISMLITHRRTYFKAMDFLVVFPVRPRSVRCNWSHTYLPYTAPCRR